MRIGIVSKLWEETTPLSVGGTGAVVGTLTEKLVRRGHDVTLFATRNSQTTAKLVSIWDTPWTNNYNEETERAHIAQAFSKKYPFDVIDCYEEQLTCPFAADSSVPTVINITYGGLNNEEKNVLDTHKKLNYVSPSLAIREGLPALNWIGMIPHGIDINRFPFSESKEDYLLFLGRLSPQKGPGAAIRIAKKLNKKLILAGKMSDTDKDYLDKEVTPFIDNEQIVYVGVADFPSKIDLLKKAKALIHPIDYVEAFGMTLIEAMACGTPVISFDHGAPKEIIQNGVTGFIAHDENQMADFVERVSSISPAACRQHVENNYTVEKMTDAYEQLYKKLL